jgi:hypothetical protein
MTLTNWRQEFHIGSNYAGQSTTSSTTTKVSHRRREECLEYAMLRANTAQAHSSGALLVFQEHKPYEGIAHHNLPPRISWRLFHGIALRLLYRTTAPSGFTCYATFADIFLCSPVAKLWRPATIGHYHNSLIYFIVSAAINISLDLVVWILPILGLRWLRLPRRQLMGPILVSILGGL